MLCTWLQANWELLVEQIVLGGGKNFLEVYGERADIDASSRVTQPDVVATHRVCCEALSGETVIDQFENNLINPSSLFFDQFVSWNGNQYSTSPPFHFTLLEDNDSRYLVSSEDIRFSVEKL